MSDNPFHLDNALGGGGGSSNTKGQAPLFSSKMLKDEIRRDDADMAQDLKTLTAKGAAASYIRDDHDGTAAGGVEINEKLTTEQYIERKREVGLVRMSLAAKKKEIRKLEEEADRAEKKLRQQQDQLESTREKFNNFLKMSNLEQDVAVRKADDETRAKMEKTVEIKKISARISRVELDIKKTETQIENCLQYKKFLDDLTKPRWFMDLLIDLRIEDATTNILMDTEKRFTARVEELKEERRREEEAAKEEEASGAGKDKKGFSSRPAAKKATGAESNTPQVSLEKQIEELHQKMEAEAQEAVEQMEKEVIAEVNAMTPEKARELVNTQYEPSRIPSYFTSVDELLDVFISVEESNLFLIQNCQELEEELEEVAMQYMTEKSEMQAMVHQRQAQMDGLSEKIQAATEKLNQLEENKRQLDGADAGLDTAGDPAKGKDGGAAVTMSRETFKEKIEEKIAYIFRTLTAGDTAIKAAMTSHDSEEGAGADPLLSPPGTTTTKSKTTPGEGTKKASPKPSAKSTKGKSGVDSTKRSAPAVHATQESEAGQNIGAVEMLTIIETN
ncbi:flagellar associated protein [Angomonas deanei]|nr:flagellar associated protein [Angomonas deanei]|eukprot:EPY26552.1 flagellar associated protein [Angomonas deanei]